ncbi:type III secretion system effector XopF1 [Xanthomonas campestris]|uniref:type III secretion system effector XopF1 n=1 Tax=Xanthomonas campestris TaxID=339 RepID=UPI0015F2A032|nr:type III secretion system effector XopF1 [Xanthomonas campestris]MEA9846129.1 type III secretion system effector XopF1 [Xanthomonas campestris pv. raphani]
MKLTSDIGTSSSSRATSPAPTHQTQGEEAMAPPQKRLPTGPLAGLPSPGPVLRGRRAALSRRAATEASHAESSHGASHRSESSHSSHSSELTDASFYTPQPSPASSVIDAPAAAATYAQRSASTAADLKAQIRTHLDKLPFAAPSEGQEALQAAYLEWADARMQERITAFGPDAGYQVVGDMKAAGAKAAWPIAYECLRAFVIGSMRTPFGLAAGAAYDSSRPPGSETLSTSTLSGAVAGVVSYASDTLLIPAMDRRARVANLPRFQAIDPKILVPDPPPVLLEITAEGKRFTRPGEGNAPTLAQLKAQTYDIRQGITQWQSTLDDKSLDTLLLKPTINAGFNAARRTSDDPGTRTPAGQLGLSALAIGGAGVVQKAMLETGKAMARTGQVSVPDLLGGQQRLNLFSLAVPDKTRRPAQWSDAVYFPPNYLLETGKEGLALARQALSTTNAITTALRDVLGRHMLSNVLANFASLGAGRLIAAPLRGGNENGSVAGEAANSTATVVQQAVQTLFNDTVWNALKAKNGANTTQATRLDQERAVTAANHQRTIERTLQALAEPIDEAIALFSAPTPAEIARALEEGVRLAPAPGPLARMLRETLERLRTEIDTQCISIATIDAVRDQLHAGWAAMFSGVPRDDVTKTLDTELRTLRRALHESEELRQWENGGP